MGIRLPTSAWYVYRVYVSNVISDKAALFRVRQCTVSTSLHIHRSPTAQENAHLGFDEMGLLDGYQIPPANMNPYERLRAYLLPETGIDDLVHHVSKPRSHETPQVACDSLGPFACRMRREGCGVVMFKEQPQADMRVHLQY